MASSPAIRRPTMADVSAVGTLFRLRDIERVGVAELSDDELAHDWAMPEFDLEQDAWVVEDAGGAVIAYADVYPDEPGSYFAEVVTAGAHELLEERLVTLVEGRAAELAADEAPVALRIPIVDTEVARAARYEVAGYRRIRTFFRMRLDPGQATPQFPLPPGLGFAPFDPAAHVEEVHAVLSSAFADHVAVARPGPFERWRHDTLEVPDFDPGCWVLARERGRLVGAVIARAERAVSPTDEDHGWIQTLGVAAGARGRGIGAAMLAEAIRRLRDRRLETIELGVDATSPTGATRLYERAGMRVVRRTDIFEKRISGRLGAG